MKHPPRSNALRKGRHSEPNARYFVTFNTESPSLSLATAEYFEALKGLILEMVATKQVSEISYTVMPDHIHTLFRLGKTLKLSQVVGKLKQQSRKSSRLNPLNWQNGYHDHKIREDSELQPTLHYLYLNPYRAKLLDNNFTWPYTHIDPDAWKWLQPLLDKECPYPEWLNE